MIWNYQEHRTIEAESEVDDVQDFAERNLHRFDVQVVAERVGFTIVRRARLYRARTANTERYSVFCILITSFYMQLVAG